MSTRVPPPPAGTEVAPEPAATAARAPAAGPRPGTGIVLHPSRARLVFAIVAVTVTAAIIAAIIVLAGGRAEPVAATKRLPVTAPGATLGAPGFAQLRSPAASQGGSLTSLIKKQVGV